MKLQDQVITIEQAKRLKELGVNADSLFMWVVPSSSDVISSRRGVYPIEEATEMHSDNEGDKWDVLIYPAYTVAELGMMLPLYCDSCNSHTGWSCIYNTRPTGIIHSEHCHKTEAQARGAMLIYLLENHLLTPLQVNEEVK